MKKRLIVFIGIVLSSNICLNADADSDPLLDCKAGDALDDSVELLQLHSDAPHPEISRPASPQQTSMAKDPKSHVKHMTSLELQSQAKVLPLPYLSVVEGDHRLARLAHRLDQQANSILSGRGASEQHTKLMEIPLIQSAKWACIAFLIVGLVVILTGGCAWSIKGADYWRPCVDINDVRGRRWSIVRAAILFSVWEMACTDQFLPNLARMKTDLGGGDFDAALSVQLFWVVKGVSGLFFGLGSDHIGRRKVILFSFVISFLAILACAFASSIVWFQIARLVQGVGEGGTSVVIGVVRDLFKDAEERSQANAYAMLVIIFGPIVAPSLGGALGVFLGWRTVFLILGVGMVLTLFYVYLYLEETLVTEERDGRQYWAEVTKFFSTYQVWALILIPALSFGLMQFFLSNMPLLLEEGFKVTPLQVSLGLGVFGFTCFLAGGLTDCMSQTLGVYRTIFIGSWLLVPSAAFCFVVAFMLSHSVWALLGVQLFFNLIIMAIWISAETLYLQPLNESYAFAQSVNTFCQLTLGSLVVAMPGTGWMQLASDRTKVYCLWMAIILCVEFVAFWVLFGVNPPVFARQVRAYFEAAKIRAKDKGEGKGSDSEDSTHASSSDTRR